MNIKRRTLYFEMSNASKFMVSEKDSVTIYTVGGIEYRCTWNNKFETWELEYWEDGDWWLIDYFCYREEVEKYLDRIA